MSKYLTMTFVTLDVFHIVCLYLPRKDRYSLLFVCRELSKIASMYLIPTQEDFEIAVEQRSADVLRSILRHFAVDPSINGCVCILYAVHRGNMDILRVLLQDHRIDPSSYLEFLFSTAIARGSLEMLDILLLHPKLDPSYSQDFPLMSAANGKSAMQLFKQLLEMDVQKLFVFF